MNVHLSIFTVEPGLRVLAENLAQTLGANSWKHELAERIRREATAVSNEVEMIRGNLDMGEVLPAFDRLAIAVDAVAAALHEANGGDGVGLAEEYIELGTRGAATAQRFREGSERWEAAIRAPK